MPALMLQTELSYTFLTRPTRPPAVGVRHVRFLLLGRLNPITCSGATGPCGGLQLASKEDSRTLWWLGVNSLSVAVHGFERGCVVVDSGG